MTPPLPPVSIIILCWNRWDLTVRCLESVRRHTTNANVEVLVVDNGSTDETPERLAELDWIRTIRNEKNLGFVRGNNVGLKAIAADHDVILLNNDVEVLQPDWVEELQRAAYAKPDIGIAGCRLILPDGRLLHAGTKIEPDTLWGQQIGSEEIDLNQFSSDREVQGIVFACAYIRRTTIDAIGGLSEAFESYFEDTDYCLRASEAGLRTVCCGSVTLMHAEHGSTDQQPRLFESIFNRSRGEFRRRWLAKLEAAYRFDVHWQSMLSFGSSFAISSRQLLPGLDELGVRMSYSYAFGLGTEFPSPEPDNTGNHFLNVFKARRPRQDEPDISVVHAHGDRFSLGRGGFRIGYTMTEVDGVPSSWVDQANALDEVWTPWTSNRDVLLRCGVKRPVHTMPLGVDTERFHPRTRPLRNPNGDFVFLATYRWFNRQALESLLPAFNSAFRRTDPVVLVCTLLNRRTDLNMRGELESLGLKAYGGRIVFLYNRDLPHYELPMLYRSADCFVSPGFGDDDGMPLLEAMACGLPAITPDWGAHADITHPGVAYPLETRGTSRAESDSTYHRGFSWAAPNVDHLIDQLRAAVEDPAETKARGARAAAEVEARWGARHAIRRIADRLDAVKRNGSRKSTVETSATSSATTIAIDLSRSIGEEITGVGRYARNLVLGLSRHGTTEFDYLLLPGLGTYVHPAYDDTFYLDAPPGRNFSVYRGRLPAFSKAHGPAPGVQLLHCTANMMPQEYSCPVLMTVHDLSFETHPQFHTPENIKLCKTNIQRAVRENATFLAVSENTRRDLIRLHAVAHNRIHVIPNTFDDQLFRPQEAEDIDRVLSKHEINRPYFLFLGTLEPRKNLTTVLSAIEEQGKGPTLVVGGARGWLDEDLRARLFHAGSRVQAIGYVPQADLPSLYAGAQALLYPSVYEGFGLPLLEAMACGTPVVASRVSAMPEVVGEAGILLEDPCDARELARAMERLSAAGPERAELTKRACKQSALFDLTSTTSKLVALYRHLLAAR